MCQNIQIDRFCHRLFVQRAVRVGLHYPIAGRQHRKLRTEGAVILLKGTEGVPEIQKHHGKVPHRSALDAQACVLPVTEAGDRVDIFICQIDAAGVGHLTVYHHDLAVVAVVHHQRKQRHHRVKGDTADMRPLHAHHKVLGQTQQAAEVIVDQPHVHPLCRLAAQDVLHALPHLALTDNEKLQKDALLRFFKVGQQRRIHGFAAGEIPGGGVLPRGIAAVLGQVAAHSPVFVAQAGGLSGLLGAVCPVCLLHCLHFAAQTLGGALVAKSQIQRPSQQRQQPDEGDPAHLIGTVFVLAHQIQNDQQAQPVECPCDPHPCRTGGEGKKHPRQPCKLQRHQRHRDRDAVEDAVEKLDDRQPEQHILSPSRVSLPL